MARGEGHRVPFFSPKVAVSRRVLRDLFARLMKEALGKTKASLERRLFLSLQHYLPYSLFLKEFVPFLFFDLLYFLLCGGCVFRGPRANSAGGVVVVADISLH